MCVDAEATDALWRAFRLVSTLLVDHDAFSSRIHDMQGVAEVFTYTRSHHSCIRQSARDYLENVGYRLKGRFVVVNVRRAI